VADGDRRDLDDFQDEAYFDRDGLYGADGTDYPDNGRRFAYLCRAALEALPRIARAPIVLHLHDWHTALAAVYLRTEFRGRQPYDSTGVVLTVHNAGFQGHFPFETLADLGLSDELYDWQRLEWHGRVNWLKGGLVYTDMATTVSPTHAHELRTAAGGFGLHETFISLGDRLVGILNGIDQHAWDPTRDPHLTAAFSAEALDGKARCKRALQRGAGFPLRARAPRTNRGNRMRAPLSDEPSANDPYEELADAFAAQVDTKPHNAYCERPATLSLLPEMVDRAELVGPLRSPHPATSTRTAIAMTHEDCFTAKPPANPDVTKTQATSASALRIRV